MKEHRVNRKPRGKMLGLRGISNLRGNSDDYKEDTRLEDRLAMEAEEEKKYETGEGYGTGGGAGGGGAGWDDAGKGVNWATNIQRQDAAEVVQTLNTMWNVLVIVCLNNNCSPSEMKIVPGNRSFFRQGDIYTIICEVSEFHLSFSRSEDNLGTGFLNVRC